MPSAATGGQSRPLVSEGAPAAPLEGVRALCGSSGSTIIHGMIPDRVVEVLHGPAFIQIGTRDGALRPAHTCAVGAVVHDDRQTVTVFVPAARSERVLRDLSGERPDRAGRRARQPRGVPAQGDVRLVPAHG